MDSDSDQDFEVLAKPVNKCMTSQSLAKFKGIYIKEDHFAEGIDDGSDIEVIRMTDPVKSILCLLLLLYYAPLLQAYKYFYRSLMPVNISLSGTIQNMLNRIAACLRAAEIWRKNIARVA